MVSKKRRKQRSHQPDDYMSPAEGRAFMDRWAAEQNEIVSHNVRTYDAELVQYASDRDLNWRMLGLEHMRRLREQDAAWGARKHAKRPGVGGRPANPRRAEVRKKVPRGLSREEWLEKTAEVADVLRLPVKKVRRWTREPQHRKTQGQN